MLVKHTTRLQGVCFNSQTNQLSPNVLYSINILLIPELMEVAYPEYFLAFVPLEMA